MRASRSLILALFLAQAAACGGPPAPGPAAEKIVRIKTVAVLQLPVRDLSPADQDTILGSMAEGLERRVESAARRAAMGQVFLHGGTMYPAAGENKHGEAT